MRKFMMAAAIAALAFTAAYGAAPAHAGTTATTVKPAKVNPFTGKLTTNYSVLDGLDYYQWQYDGDTSYCVYDDGEVVDLYTCTGERNDYWAAPFWGGTGAWNYDQYIKSESSGNCLADPGEADNIRVELASGCTEVGGQSWVISSWGSYTEVTCGLGYYWHSDPSTPEENVTEPFALKQDAWIVTAGYIPSGSLPADMRWIGLPT